MVYWAVLNEGHRIGYVVLCFLSVNPVFLAIMVDID
jgi:hypothetical protein